MEHLHRHPECPASLTLAIQDDLWLETMRALHSSEGSDAALRAGRTCTRRGRGRPVRWGQLWVQAVQEAYGWDSHTRDKGATRERASTVETVLERGAWEGVGSCDF